MIRHQKGFGIVEIIIVIVIVGLLGFGGWFVWQRSQNESKKSNSSTNNIDSTVNAVDQEREEMYQVPDGYKVYENSELGFKFAYPEEWGELQEKTSPDVLFAAETSELNPSPQYVWGKIELSAAKVEDFVHHAVYHGASIKPIKSGSDYTWEVVEPGLQSDKYSPGDPFIPEESVFTGRNLKTIIFERKNLKVHNFATGHACGAWYSFAFASGDHFVGIKFPAFCADDAPEEEGDAAFEAYKDTIQQIAQTIRVDE